MTGGILICATGGILMCGTGASWLLAEPVWLNTSPAGRCRQQMELAEKDGFPGCTERSSRPVQLCSDQCPQSLPMNPAAALHFQNSPGSISGSLSLRTGRCAPSPSTQEPDCRAHGLLDPGDPELPDLIAHPSSL